MTDVMLDLIKDCSCEEQIVPKRFYRDLTVEAFKQSALTTTDVLDWKRVNDAIVEKYGSEALEWFKSYARMYA